MAYWPQFYPRACTGCANICWCHGSLRVGVAPAPSDSWYRADREHLDSDRDGRRHEGLARSADWSRGGTLPGQQGSSRQGASSGAGAPHHDPRIDGEVAAENDQQVARHEPNIRQHIIRSPQRRSSLISATVPAFKRAGCAPADTLAAMGFHGSEVLKWRCCAEAPCYTGASVMAIMVFYKRGLVFIKSLLR